MPFVAFRSCQPPLTRLVRERRFLVEPCGTPEQTPALPHGLLDCRHEELPALASPCHALPGPPRGLDPLRRRRRRVVGRDGFHHLSRPQTAPHRRERPGLGRYEPRQYAAGNRSPPERDRWRVRARE